MCTAVIVVSLPTLKPLIMRITPVNTSNRSTSGYVNPGPRRSLSHPLKDRKTGDDEIELVLQESRKSSLTTNATGAQEAKDGVRVTTNIAITREVI
jgi:hypothetical protein